MSRRTVEHLERVREELLERRVQLAYRIGGAYRDRLMEDLVLVHQAIAALDAVIAEGRDEPAPVEPQAVTRSGTWGADGKSPL